MADGSSTQQVAVPDRTGTDNPEPKNEGKGEDSEADEFSVRQREVEEFSKLVDESVRADIGASSTGLYELVG